MTKEEFKVNWADISDLSLHECMDSDMEDEEECYLKSATLSPVFNFDESKDALRFIGILFRIKKESDLKIIIEFEEEACP
jgi:hypothetical protein